MLVICFRRTTSWASSRAIVVCVCVCVCICESDLFIETMLPCWRCLVITHAKECVRTWQHGAAFYLFKVISSVRSMSDKWGNLVSLRAHAEEEKEEERRNESWTRDGGGSKYIAVRHFAFLNPLLWFLFIKRCRFDRTLVSVKIHRSRTLQRNMVWRRKLWKWLHKTVSQVSHLRF